jgi:hypothetical protein
VKPDLSYRDQIIPPDTEGWRQRDLIRDVLDLIGKAIRQGQVGVYVVVFAPAWKPYLDARYLLGTGIPTSRSLRQRLKQSELVLEVFCSPRLSGWEVLLSTEIGLTD